MPSDPIDVVVVAMMSYERLCCVALSVVLLLVLNFMTLSRNRCFQRFTGNECSGTLFKTLEKAALDVQCKD